MNLLSLFAVVQGSKWSARIVRPCSRCVVQNQRVIPSVDVDEIEIQAGIVFRETERIDLSEVRWEHHDWSERYTSASVSFMREEFRPINARQKLRLSACRLVDSIAPDETNLAPHRQSPRSKQTFAVRYFNGSEQIRSLRRRDRAIRNDDRLSEQGIEPEQAVGREHVGRSIVHTAVD